MIATLAALAGLVAGESGASLALPSEPIHLDSAGLAALPPVSGRPLTQEELDGRPVVLELWATWCPPCLAAMRELEPLATAPELADVSWVGVSLDRIERSKVRSWLLRQGLAIPQLHDRSGFSGRLASELGVDRLPARLVFDRGGRLVARNPTVAELREILRELRDSPRPPAAPTPSRSADPDNPSGDSRRAGSGTRDRAAARPAG